MKSRGKVSSVTRLRERKRPIRTRENRSFGKAVSLGILLAIVGRRGKKSLWISAREISIRKGLLGGARSIFAHQRGNEGVQHGPPGRAIFLLKLNGRSLRRPWWTCGDVSQVPVGHGAGAEIHQWRTADWRPNDRCGIGSGKPVCPKRPEILIRGWGNQPCNRKKGAHVCGRSRGPAHGGRREPSPGTRKKGATLSTSKKRLSFTGKKL